MLCSRTHAVEVAVPVVVIGRVVVVAVVVALGVTLAVGLAGGHAGYVGQVVVGRGGAGAVGSTGR